MREHNIFDSDEHVSLCEVLDRVLNKGAVISGSVTIAVADVDLVDLNLQLVLASAGTIRKLLEPVGLEGRTLAVTEDAQ